VGAFGVGGVVDAEDSNSAGRCDNQPLQPDRAQRAGVATRQFVATVSYCSPSLTLMAH